MGEAKRRRERGEDWTQQPGYKEQRQRERTAQLRREIHMIESEKKYGAQRRRAIIGVYVEGDMVW